MIHIKLLDENPALTFNSFVHPFIFLNRFTVVCWSLSQLSRAKAGWPLDKWPVLCRATRTDKQTYSHLHTHTTDNLEFPVCLTGMLLECEKKPKYLERTQTQGKNADSTLKISSPGIKPATFTFLLRYCSIIKCKTVPHIWYSIWILLNIHNQMPHILSSIYLQ